MSPNVSFIFWHYPLRIDLLAWTANKYELPLGALSLASLTLLLSLGSFTKSKVQSLASFIFLFFQLSDKLCWLPSIKVKGSNPGVIVCHILWKRAWRSVLKARLVKVFYIVTYSGSIHDGTLMHSKVQYTTLDYSSQLFYNSNTRITSTSSLI
jgi:hypothetical protein